MKIVQINAVNSILSTGATTKQLADFLTKEGVENYTFSRVGRGFPKETIFIGNLLDYRLHGLLSRVFGYQGFFSLIPTIILIRRLKTIKPDIVHLRNLHENYVNIPLLLKYLGKNNIIVVVTLHDCFFYTGRCPHYTRFGCNKWELFQCRDCKFMAFSKYSWLWCGTHTMFKIKERLFNGIKNLCVVGVSNWICNESKRSPIFKNAKFDMIYNWIDLETFHPFSEQQNEKTKNLLGLSNKNVVIGVASSWCEEKGLSLFFELSHKIEKDTQIVLVGNMPSNIELPANITPLPKTLNQNELAKYYSCANVFVHLSKEESFGKVTAESLACGTPAVVFNNTASPEIVADGCGFSVENGNVDAVAESIGTICARGKKSYLLSCRKRAEERFNIDINCRQYLELYKKLLANAK